jgi:hypothetical protein
MINFRFFSYSKYLESQIKEKDARIEHLEKRNQELILSLFSKGLTPPEVIPQKKHDIKKLSETSATCTCGWNFASDEPSNLQMAISEHYRQSVISGGRKKWTQLRDAAEDRALITEIKGEENEDR